MTNEQREFLDTIEPADTSATVARLAAIRQEAREEVDRENRERLAGSTEPQQEEK